MQKKQTKLIPKKFFWGVYLVRKRGVPGPGGRGIPGPGGCTWSWGVYLVLVPGGCTWSWGAYLVPGGSGPGGMPGPGEVSGLGGIPGPGGCTWSQGGVPGPGGCLVWGVSGPGGLVQGVCVWSWGVSGPGGVWLPGDGVCSQGGVVCQHALRQTPPPL